MTHEIKKDINISEKVFYHKDDKLFCKETYVYQNILSIYYYIVYENTRVLILTENYKDSLQHGDTITYYENGKEKLYNKYNKNILKLSISYNTEGNPIHYNKYNDLSGEIKRWHHNGQLKYQHKYSKCGINTDTAFFYDNGQTKKIYSYKNCKKHGFFNKWFPCGRIKYCFYFYKGWSYDLYKIIKLQKIIKRILLYKRFNKWIKSKSFNEWWYNPSNTGGKMVKKIMLVLMSDIKKQ